MLRRSFTRPAIQGIVQQGLAHQGQLRGLSCRSLRPLSLPCDCEGLWNEGRETRHSLGLRRLCARIAKAAIQAIADRSHHAALRTKVGCAQEADFAKLQT